jgi:hypothetical protein
MSTPQHLAGALGLPIEPVGDCLAPGAPTLLALLTELTLAVRTQCDAAWHLHYPAEPVVRNAFPRDPTEGDFLSNDLPALFLWHANMGETEQIADDFRVTTDNLSLMWIPHPAPDVKAQLTSQFWNGLDKAIRLVCGKSGSGQHNEVTSWGGNTATRLGLWDLTVGRAEPSEARIDTGGQVMTFNVYLWAVTVRESIGTPITSTAQPISSPSLNAIYRTARGEDSLVVAESQFPNP